MAPGIGSAVPVRLAESGEIPHFPTGRLFHHSLVTSDFDALRFHAAASLQLHDGNKYRKAALTDDRLIASPYNEPLHLLDLKTLDIPNQLLAKALTLLKPVRDDYATAEYTEALNWQTVIDFLRELSDAEGYEWKEQSFYVVVFRSCLKATADNDYVYELDARSHEEATASGGLLKYWFGRKDENHQNLATCVWRSREDAREGGKGPWHKKARGAAHELYAQITFTTMKLVIGDQAKRWEIVDDKS